jgi:UDP-N-acetyl-2-amino-2-deoxyglucuronate dehydrogenase
MKEKVRIGILGGGGILGAHAPAYMKLQDICNVVMVAEPKPERAKVIHSLLGPDVRIVKDYHEVLDVDEVDAVDSILPHDLHMPAVIASAKAGKPIITEKVMARNVWECDRMIEACEKAGVSLTVCHDRRYNGEWMALKDVVDSGVLGEIFFWKLEHNQDVLFPEDSWARTRDGIGGGAIMSCLTHQIDALRWYGGEIDSITCMTKVMPQRMEGEFLGVMIAQMSSGALAELSINWWTRSQHGANALWYEMVQVCGTKGEAYYMIGRGTFVKLFDRSNEPAIKKYGENVLQDFVKVESGTWGGHDRCIAEWVKSLRGEDSNIITSGRECRKTVEVAEAAYRSVESGKVVALPIKPKKWVNSVNSSQ